MGQPLSNATIVVAKGLLQGKTFALRTSNALGKILFPLSTVCLCHFVPPVSLIQRDGYAGVGFFRGCTSWVGGGLYRMGGGWWVVLVLLHVGADGGLFRCCTSGAGIGLYSTVQ